MADRPPEFTGQFPSSFDDEEAYNEKPMHKIKRKLKEEPLVPLGIGLTVFAFVNAYRALRKGDSRQANKMFRARIAAQGFTVVAMVAGSMYYSKDREKTKELRKLKDERDAEEKRQKWIRELEARDEEDKAMRALIQKKQSNLATSQSDSASSGEETQGTGGILGKMGLWPKGEKAAAEAAKAEAAVEPTSEKKSRRENPKSSLGALSEIYGKKDDESKK
ncbi:altered inheritance-mitochondria protein 31, mitochondrial [Trichoderma gamsii]|uniref:Altered inheritance-mitochondria protein 31, mitochondrial n=1 Tax=Trichoderma gamsii TaxID=398673 RepID=A0A2P4ZVX0_9HYPO|nr:altered inheritance-mitochondria protein 31, mitochondrial [Trichoderma gamsii]PON28422.1 altered inheritance-mitochondria protein 31, mitochondrial [Trichoderma gamsii]